MTPAQTSPETPNMLYPSCRLQMAGQAQTHLPCRLHVPAQSPWPRRRSADSPVARELCQPRTDGDVEARYGEQPESLRARAKRLSIWAV